MKQLLTFLSILFCASGFSQTLYVPPNPDSVKVLTNVANLPRYIWGVDLSKNRVSLTKHIADSSTLRGLVNTNTTAIVGKVNISDTASMLNNYRTGMNANTITASNTTLKYWNGYKSFVSLNADSIANGSANMLEVSQGSMPTATAGRLWNNTSYVFIPNTNNQFIYNPGLYYANGSKFIQLTTDQQINNVNWVGDSWTYGYGLASQNNGFVNKVSNYKGWSQTNVGANGITMTGINYFLGGQQDAYFMEVGVNDMRSLGYSALYNYAGMMRAFLTYRGSGSITSGSSGTKSTPSDWIPDSVNYNYTLSTKTTVNNSPITFKIVGNVVYAAIAYMTSNTVTYSITIDGVARGTFTASPTAYVTSGFDGNANSIPFCHRFPGLSDGAHTVVLQKTGGSGQFRVIYVASNSKPSYSRIWTLTVGKMTQGTAGTSGYAFWGGSDTAVNSFNNVIYNTVNDLANDGLKVSVIDINKYYSPQVPGYVQSDSLHPTDAGNTAIAQGIIEEIGQVRPSERQAIQQLQRNIDIHSDIISLGTSVQFDNNATTGETRFLLYDISAGTYKRVSIGAADSGGSGYKVLRIPN